MYKSTKYYVQRKPSWETKWLIYNKYASCLLYVNCFSMTRTQVARVHRWGEGEKKKHHTLTCLATWNFNLFHKTSRSKNLENVNCSLIFLYIIPIYGGSDINRYIFSLANACEMKRNLSFRYVGLKKSKFCACEFFLSNKRFMPPVRLELTAFRLWDWRAAYCATEAQ